LAGRSLQKLSRQSKVNLRADKITAVPFVPDTFSMPDLFNVQFGSLESSR